MRFFRKLQNSLQKRITKGIFKSCIVNYYHKLFYYHAGDLNWMGTRTVKNPNDLWIYQEIIVEQKPDLIIETGTRFGGSAMFLAHICDILGTGKIISIDTDTSIQRPSHARVQYVADSSTSAATLQLIKSQIQPHTKLLFILDSDHSKKHVLDELMAYAPLVKTGEYIIVEDTNINGNPVLPHFGPGPMEAVKEFLKINTTFESDRSRERLFHTHNPKGFLRKK